MSAYITFVVGGTHLVVVPPPKQAWGFFVASDEANTKYIKYKAQRQHSHHFQEFQVIPRSRVYLHHHRVPENKDSTQTHGSGESPSEKQCNTTLYILFFYVYSYRKTTIAIWSPLPLEGKRFKALIRAIQ